MLAEMQPEWTIGLGIAFSIFFTRKTGFTCGGIITPGLLALHMNDPLNVAVVLALGILISIALEACVRLCGTYGRERVALALLMALAARLLLGTVLPAPSPWLGWVVPGLVGADIQRQGPIGTLAGAMAVAISAAFASELLAGVLS